MAAARQELGSDAMLVNTRRAPAESRHLGEYEVVFGLETAVHARHLPLRRRIMTGSRPT